MVNKITVIAVVVILVAVTTVGAFVITKNDSKDDDSYNIDAALQVYGNANSDYIIDSNDLALIKDIIAGNESFSEYPLADANYDGVVNNSDVELVQKILNKEKCVVYHVNTCSTGNYVASTSWPITSALSTGAANNLLLLTMAGVKDMIHGISYSTVPDSTLFPTFSKMTSLSSSSTKMGLDAAGDIIKEYSVTALITDKTASTISNEAEFEAAGIDVIRVAAALVDVDESSSQLLLIGFLFCTETQCMEIAEWETNLMNYISEKLEGVEKVTAITSNGASSKGAWVSAGVSDYVDVIEAAGGEYALDESVLTDYTSGAYFGSGDTWLYNYEFDYIISIRTNDWYSGTVDVDTKYNDSMSYFTMTEAYENGNAYVIVGDGPVVIRVAYAACVLYPDIFTEEWADSMNQEFFENYYDEDIDFTDLFFIISPDMVST